MTYYDRLNKFFDENEINPLSPSAQLLYLHILHEFNRLRNPEAFYITDIRLAAMTGISRQSITEAKRMLKNRGWIYFKTDKRNPRAGTRYTLPETAARKPQDANDGRQIQTTGAVISADIQQAWKTNNDGISPTETEAYYLADDVKIYGEDKVKQAIIRAGQKRQSGGMNIYFYKMQLSDIISRKEGTGNGRRTTNSGVNRQIISQYGGFGADAAPEG